MTLQWLISYIAHSPFSISSRLSDSRVRARLVFGASSPIYVRWRKGRGLSAQGMGESCKCAPNMKTRKKPNSLVIFIFASVVFHCPASPRTDGYGPTDGLLVTRFLLVSTLERPCRMQRVRVSTQYSRLRVFHFLCWVLMPNDELNFIPRRCCVVVWLASRRLPTSEPALPSPSLLGLCFRFLRPTCPIRAVF